MKKWASILRSVRFVLMTLLAACASGGSPLGIDNHSPDARPDGSRIPDAGPDSSSSPDARPNGLDAGEPPDGESLDASGSDVRDAKTDAPTRDGGTIDRYTVVTRHNITLNDVAERLPIGNGEFCFGADGTGLQTFSGNTMSHWAWHSFPLPAGWTKDQVPATGTFAMGRVTGGEVFPAGTDAIRTWMRDNPHKFNLARLRFTRRGGADLAKTDIAGLSRTLDLWSGMQTSNFKIDGQPVRVETSVHPDLDLVAVRIDSPLLETDGLEVVLDFPYPTFGQEPWLGDFSKAHTNTDKIELTRNGDHAATFQRTLDETIFHAALQWSSAWRLQEPAPAANSYRLIPNGVQQAEFSLAFSAAPIASSAPIFDETRQSAANRWENFWLSGGAIDLSQSKDSRWMELERRVVLSQYNMAAQSAGDWPSAEVGLMALDPWRARFHMEMVWWHLAHYALWDRWDIGDKAIGAYMRLAPAARALAQQLGYKGLKWPKSVGPEGRSAPWVGNQVLLWKQPHPIFFAELEYRLRPTPATLSKWAAIVQGTAEHMADYVTRDQMTGVYSLVPAMPPSEQGITRDTVFDLAYWRWGLTKAQEWRERMGLPRDPTWDEIVSHLAPLPVVDGLFVHSSEWHDTYTNRATGHPDPLGVLGMLPPMAGVDANVAQRTVAKIWDVWKWDQCWGWDFPWMAMAAARTGQPKLAVEALLKQTPPNSYPASGINNGWYLPGNGGLLYAVAMMAAGWSESSDPNAPGFPHDGSWVVKWEGLKQAP